MAEALKYFNEDGWTLQHFNEMTLLSKEEQKSSYMGAREIYYSLGSNKNEAGLPCNCKGVTIIAFDRVSDQDEGLCSDVRIGTYDENGEEKEPSIAYN